MSAFRGHLLAATRLVLSLHVVGAVLGAAQVCIDRPHTHGGREAPTCPMHHQQSPVPAASASHHAHHQTPPAPAPVESGTTRMSCDCSGDLLTFFLGQLAMLAPPPSTSPFVQAVALDVLSDPFAVDLWYAPPSPPPR